MKNFIFYKDTDIEKDRIFVFPSNDQKTVGHSYFKSGNVGFSWNFREMELNKNIRISLEEAYEIVGKRNLDLYLSSFLPKKVPKWKAIWKEN